MRRILLASHGRLAKGMRNTLEMIIGEDSRIDTLMLEPGHHPDEMKQLVEGWIENAPEDEFLIICDVFGGSVANTFMQLCHMSNVHVVTGMNLGLLISICTGAQYLPIEDLIRQSLDHTAKYILYANDLIKEKGRIQHDQNA